MNVQVILDKNMTNMRGTVCRLYRLGRIPFVSSITGLYQALLGTVHAIVHLVYSIFSDNRNHHLREAKLGGKHIVLGLTTAVPVIGNIFMIFFCLIKQRKEERMISESYTKDSRYNQVPVRGSIYEPHSRE